MNICNAEVIQASNRVKELLTVQEGIISNLHNENLKLTDISYVQSVKELNELEMFIKIYQNRLVALKKEMKSLHDKSKYLKDKAGKLNQTRQKYILKP